MASVEIQVEQVAHLARLDLSREEIERLRVQLQQILGYVDKLRELDVSNVEPTAHAIPRSNVTRPDETRPSLAPEAVLANAPLSANGLFLVPKIVE